LITNSMKIDRIHVYNILLPFSSGFNHSLRKRLSVKNVVVEVVAEGGEHLGYGEAAPRPYVTGESQERCAKSIGEFARRKEFPWDLADLSHLWDFIDGFSDGKENNAALCALETALLDALARYQGKNIIDFFSKDHYTDTIGYGAAIPLDSKERVADICGFIQSTMAIAKIKLKMGRDLLQNQEALEAIQMVFGRDYDLKADINGVWNRELAFKHMALIKKFGIRVVEEPMVRWAPGFVEFAEALRDNHVFLMADEAACSFQDVKNIVKENYYTMINVRLSKCGGFRRTFRIINFLRKKGGVFQIACHLGESGILSAAGRALSLLCSDAVYHDGSYDEFLLKENTTVENISFGHGGIAGPLKGYGIGVNVNRHKLERLAMDSEKITVIRS